MEEVERTNTAIVYLNQHTGFVPRQDSYAMNVDQERNCYSCGEFGHIARNCRNWKIVKQERRLEYRDNKNSNLNEEENLIVFN